MGLQARAGERIAGDAELGVTLLGELEQMGVVEISAAPDGVVPPLHVHERHAECFFVLEGELTLRLEDGERRIGPETWVFVPPGVAHTFMATGSGRVRYLDVHAPSSGLGAFVRGLHGAQDASEAAAVQAAFDQRPPPEYATGDPDLVLFRRTGGAGGVGSTKPPMSEGETITDRPGRRAILLVDADELTVSEFTYGGGERGAQLHVHHHHADGFLVVDGEFTFSYRDGSFAAPAGTLVLFPPGVVHGFDNDSGETARCFNFHMPASGFADYLRGRNPGFDQHDPPADGGVDPASAITTRLTG